MAIAVRRSCTVFAALAQRMSGPRRHRGCRYTADEQAAAPVSAGAASHTAPAPVLIAPLKFAQHPLHRARGFERFFHWIKMAALDPFHMTAGRPAGGVQPRLAHFL